MEERTMLIDTRYRVRLNDRPSAVVTPVKLLNITNERSVVVMAIWDTGSTYSSVTQRVIDELGLESFSPCITNGVGGAVTGMTRIILTFPGNSRFCTWVEMSEVIQLANRADVLLGLDVISRGDLHLTHERDGLWFEFVFDPSSFIDTQNDDSMTVMRKLTEGLQDFRKTL